MTRRGYAAPEDEIEIALAKIWAELLGVEPSRTQRSFLRAWRALTACGAGAQPGVAGDRRVHASFGSVRSFRTRPFARDRVDQADRAGVRCGRTSRSDRIGAVNMVGSSKADLRDLDAAEVRKLLSLARDRGRNANRNGPASIPAVPRDGPLALSFAQQRLWLLAQLDGINSNYHIRGALHLTGDLDVVAWRRSLDRLFARHEALRSVFRVADGQPRVELLPADARPAGART